METFLSSEELEGERQIIEIRKETEKAEVEEELTVELVDQAVEEEKEMETQPVYDTRTTKIVRPLQFDRLSAMQKRYDVIGVSWTFLNKLIYDISLRQ